MVAILRYEEVIFSLTKISEQHHPFSAVYQLNSIWFKAAVLKHCSESRKRLPSTLCAALSSLSMKPLAILCNRVRSAIKQDVTSYLC